MPLTFEKLAHLTATLRDLIYRDPVPLETWQICDHLPYNTPLPAPDDDAWRTLAVGELWGSSLSWAWLTTAATLPEGFVARPAAMHVEFETLSDPNTRILTAPEALVRVTGIETPQQALNMAHHELLLTEEVQPGDSVQIVMECFTGVSQPGGFQTRLKIAELVWIDREVEALYWDAKVLLDSIATLPEASVERARYLRLLDEAFNHINWLAPPHDTFHESVKTARAALHETLYDVPAPETSGAAPRPLLHALGHAHIDVAWLWPLNVTRGKAARTFSTALALMARYPDYTFTQSQPHLYKMVSEDDPALFERIKTRIAEGRWNATGAMWVEPDTNVPNGESLARQLLVGMRYFERELGVRPGVLWLPDVFGYSAALPQLMRLAGIRYFFTNKLSWNQFNRFPYDTFWWEGLDGSRVLTQLSTTPELPVRSLGIDRNCYNAQMLPQEVWESWERYAQKGMNHHLAVAYGWGDGGGGPTPGMIERRARMDNLPGMPQVRHSTAEDFFQALEATVPNNLPRWVGELYLEYHRGTYTSQAHIKRHNRKTEVLLHNTEALSALAHLLGQDYPALDEAWEIVLLNQFHDILPGSSIRMVNDEAARDYARAQNQANDALQAALRFLASHMRFDPDMQGIAVFNTLGTSRGEPLEVTLPGKGPVEVIGPEGPVPFQWINADERRALLLPEQVPAYGHTGYIVNALDFYPQAEPPNAVFATATRMENGLLRAEFDERGNLVRLYDLENRRDVLAEGEIGNQLCAYVDRPPKYDAWDVEVFVEDQGWTLEPFSARLIEQGPLRATLEVIYQFHDSHIVQRISMLAGSRVLVFDTDVAWHERHILLRAHFPLAIRALNASYEVQFGTVERPTHQNTSWDVARHEVPAQQWADLSEAGYGVSLLNDCKYGYSARDNVLALSLLRSPTHPDPEADQGAHTFTYALYPHTGDWRNGTIQHARRLNVPLLAHPVHGGGTWLPVRFGLVACDAPNVLIDTLKKAEDSDDLIVRVYEAHGGRAEARLRFAAHILNAEEVNLLEEPLKELAVREDTLTFSMTPYQIRSFRVQLGDLLEKQLG